MDSQTDIDANLETAYSLLRQAAAKGAQLIVFPECMNYCGSDYAGNAEELPEGRTFRILQEAAKQYGVWIHCGSIHEKRENGIPYNTSFVVDPDGRLRAVYRKLHLFDMELDNAPGYRESDHVSAGNEIETIQTETVGMLGLSICYDLRFPEQFRLEALQGADVFCNPSCFNSVTGRAHWEVLLRARAIENGCYMIASDQIGTKPAMQAYGHTMIVDPWGTVLAGMEDGCGFVTAEIDTGAVDAVRRKTGTLVNRRNDCYELHEQ